MTRHRDAGIVVALALVAAIAPVRAQEPPVTRSIFREDFSDGIDAWRVQRLDGRSTIYLVVDLDGDSVLKASSNNAAAALLMPATQESISEGRLRWSWRVMNSLTDNSRETERDGDDYAARVFVLFGDPELGASTRALAYVWAGRAPVGSRFPNPTLSQVSTIVLQSGDEHAGEWMIEDRDIFADYERSFGDVPPAFAGIALLVDTDDTGGAAMAWFDAIELRVPGTP